MRLDLDQTGFDCTMLNNQGDIRINTRADLDDSRHRIEAHQTGIEMTQMTYIHPMDRAARLNVTPLEEERSDDISEEATDSTDSESDTGAGPKRIRQPTILTENQIREENGDSLNSELQRKQEADEFGKTIEREYEMLNQVSVEAG